MQQQLRDFAAVLWEPRDIVELRLLMNGTSDQSWCYACDFPGKAASLTAKNRSGFNCYAGVAPRMKAGASGDDSIELCRTLFADFDPQHFPADCTDQEAYVRDKIKEVGLPIPTMTINSGHGQHAYWRLHDPLKPDIWKRGNRRLSELLGSDKAVSNPERIMRIAGLTNNKPPAARCRIVESDCMCRYAVGDFAVLRQREKPEQVQPPPARSRPVGDQAIRAAAYARTWETLLEGQGRNVAMFAHVKVLLNDMQIPLDVVRQVVTDWNRSNTPPLDDREFERTFQSAMSGNNQHAPGCKNDREAPSKVVTLSQPKDDPAKELGDMLEDNISGKRRSIPWPWDMLNRYTQALLPGQLCLLCGAEGSTKSFFLLEAAVYWHTQGVKVAILEGEEPRKYHLNRCLAQLAEESRLMNANWCLENPDATRAAFTEHRQFISDFGKWVYDNQQQLLSLPDMAAWARERAKEGCRILAIDPVTSADRQGRSAHDDDKQFIHDCQSIATEYQCSILCVTHPSKAWVDADTSHISGGASYARFFQTILWLESHGDRDDDWPVSTVSGPCGSTQIAHGRTLRLLKSRDEASKGFRLAANFQRHNLRLKVEGIIHKEKR